MSTSARVLRVLVSAAAFAAGAVSIASCQQSGTPRDAAAGFMAQSAYGLHYVDTGDGAKLAYGMADSEMMSLMLECQKGSSTVEISDVAHGADRLVLASEGRRSSFNAEVSPAPMAPILVARTSTAAPALAAFRETGRVEVTNGSLHYAIHATNAERAGVERFFTACDSPGA